MTDFSEIKHEYLRIGGAESELTVRIVGNFAFVPACCIRGDFLILPETLNNTLPDAVTMLIVDDDCPDLVLIDRRYFFAYGSPNIVGRSRKRRQQGRTLSYPVRLCTAEHGAAWKQFETETEVPARARV